MKKDEKEMQAPEEKLNAEADGVELLEGEHVVTLPEQGLNLRGTPMVDAPILEVIPAGTVLQVIPLPYDDPGWCPVVCGLYLGWVDRRYIEVLPPSEEG